MIQDTAAHEVIWKGLRAVFGPRLNIVGEEDVIEEENDWEINDEPEVDALNGYDMPTDLQKLVFSDVVVFIDPVDGTREFVEGRLGACQNLIGISYRGRAVAGVVGLPFTRYCTDLSSILLLSLFLGNPMMNQQYAMEILRQESYLELWVFMMFWYFYFLSPRKIIYTIKS